MIALEYLKRDHINRTLRLCSYTKLVESAMYCFNELVKCAWSTVIQRLSQTCISAKLSSYRCLCPAFIDSAYLKLKVMFMLTVVFCVIIRFILMMADSCQWILKFWRIHFTYHALDKVFETKTVQNMGVVLIDKYAESEHKELTGRLKFQGCNLSCLTHVCPAVENCCKSFIVSGRELLSVASDFCWAL